MILNVRSYINYFIHSKSAVASALYFFASTDDTLQHFTSTDRIEYRNRGLLTELLSRFTVEDALNGIRGEFEERLREELANVERTN